MKLFALIFCLFSINAFADYQAERGAIFNGPAKFRVTHPVKIAKVLHAASYQECGSILDNKIIQANAAAGNKINWVEITELPDGTRQVDFASTEGASPLVPALPIATAICP